MGGPSWNVRRDLVWRQNNDNFSYVARGKQVFGDCHICGLYSKLSFEHVPPEAAFNDRNIRQVHGFEAIHGQDLDNLRGRLSQRGAGGYTLCKRFACQAARILIFTRARATLYYPYHIYPLRVLKQIICMFFSANGPSFQSKYPDLVRFVLNKEQKYLQPDLQIYAFLSESDRSRQTGIAAIANLDNKVRTISEITFPPIGFVMALSSERPDDRLIDISFFARYPYNKWTDVSLNLPALPIYTYLPGDYRSREQVLSGMKNN
jgi:hypothetical protein